MLSLLWNILLLLRIMSGVVCNLSDRVLGNLDLDVLAFVHG